MHQENEQLVFSATDLADFLGCHHTVGLNLAVEEGAIAKLYRNDAMSSLLRELGEKHEDAYLHSLRKHGKNVVEISRGETARDATLQAMKGGADIIAQAALADLGSGARSVTLGDF